MKIDLKNCCVKTQDLVVDGIKSVLFIVMHENEIIASCLFHYSLTYPAWGQDFFVSEKYRENGVAKMMIGKVEERMKKSGCNRLSGFCIEENLEFWQKLGWEIEIEVEEGFHILKYI